MAWAAPTATALKTQKPQPPATLSKPSTHAWCPGGRTRQNAVTGGSSALTASIDLSMAAMTAPAARVVARHVPAETMVIPKGVLSGKSRSVSTGDSGRGAVWLPHVY